MKTVDEPEELRHIVRQWRNDGLAVALVPTMGNLHEGHIRLIADARQNADRVIASIFVNPTQFGEGEDFAEYPRTPDDDARRLQSAGADLLFQPSVDTMYPAGTGQTTEVHVPGLEDIYCGEFRPGHFCGVATVVTRLFNLVQPDIAVFGEKDWQQLLVIKRMVRELGFPVAIRSVATVRESDGLAMSSRNRYFSDLDRSRAPVLYQTICAVVSDCQAGEDEDVIKAQAQTRLAEAGFRVEYLDICRADDLLKPVRQGDRLIALVAARLGPVRLIDNIVFTKT